MSANSYNRDAGSRGNLFVMDANDGPCVRSLCSAMAGRGWNIRCFRPYGLSYYRNVLHGSWGKLFHWRPAGPNVQEEYAIVPGLRRFQALSAAVLRARAARAIRRFGPPAAIIYTLPFYESVARGLKGAGTSVYFAYDAYRYYAEWNTRQVAALEDRMLHTVDLVCVVSRQLHEDFQDAGRPVHYLPNAASDAAIHCPGEGDSTPESLRGVAGPIIGCVGMIQSGYDWELVRKMAEAFPHASLVFLGHVPAEPTEWAAVAECRNVRFPGFVEHKEAMRCLRWFDVCLNPMSLSAFNHRRCPLRLYDYLCTDKPVLSTAIREALELRPHIAVGADHAEMLALLNCMLEGGYAQDLEGRRVFMHDQTWSARAEQCERILFEAQCNRGGKA